MPSDKRDNSKIRKKALGTLRSELPKPAATLEAVVEYEHFFKGV